MKNPIEAIRDLISELEPPQIKAIMSILSEEQSKKLIDALERIHFGPANAEEDDLFWKQQKRYLFEKLMAYVPMIATAIEKSAIQELAKRGHRNTIRFVPLREEMISGLSVEQVSIEIPKGYVAHSLVFPSYFGGGVLSINFSDDNDVRFFPGDFFVSPALTDDAECGGRIPDTLTRPNVTASDDAHPDASASNSADGKRRGWLKLSMKNNTGAPLTIRGALGLLPDET